MSTKISLTLSFVFALVVTFIVSIVSYWLLPYTPTQREIFELVVPVLIGSFVLGLILLLIATYIVDLLNDSIEDAVEVLKDSICELKELVIDITNLEPVNTYAKDTEDIQRAIQDSYAEQGRQAHEAIEEAIEDKYKGLDLVVESVDKLMYAEACHAIKLGYKIRINSINAVVIAIPKNTVLIPLIEGVKYNYILYDLDSRPSKEDLITLKHKAIINTFINNGGKVIGNSDASLLIGKGLSAGIDARINAVPSKDYIPNHIDTSLIGKGIVGKPVSKIVSSADEALDKDIAPTSTISVPTFFDIERLEMKGLLSLGDKLKVRNPEQLLVVIDHSITVSNGSTIFKGNKFNYKLITYNSKESVTFEVIDISTLLRYDMEDRIAIGNTIKVLSTGVKYKTITKGTESELVNYIAGKNFNYIRI